MAFSAEIVTEFLLHGPYSTYNQIHRSGQQRKFAIVAHSVLPNLPQWPRAGKELKNQICRRIQIYIRNCF